MSECLICSTVLKQQNELHRKEFFLFGTELCSNIYNYQWQRTGTVLRWGPGPPVCGCPRISEGFPTLN